MTGKTKCSFQLLIYPRNQLFACQTFFLLFDDLLRFVLSISFFRCVLASLNEALSVHWLVRPSVGPSVTLLSKSMKNGLLWILSDLDSAGRGRKRDEEEVAKRR